MAVMALPARLLVQPVAKVNTLLSYSAAVRADLCWAVAGRRPGAAGRLQDSARALRAVAGGCGVAGSRVAMFYSELCFQ